MKTIAYLMFLSILLVIVCVQEPHAFVLDKVVAYINDDAITLSELDVALSKAKSIKPFITQEEVLNTLINKRLLLMDAERLRIDGADSDSVLNEYLDIKVRALIRITDTEIADFYDQNKKEFKSVELSEVSDKIRLYLEEKELNVRLGEHLASLRKDANVRVLPEGD